MATINEITIKTYREFSGVEYPTIREAVVWKNGKKIGTFAEDAWGGPAHFSNELGNIVAPSALLYQKGCPQNIYTEFESNTEVFIGHVLQLVEYEKIYRANCKNGYPTTLYICNDWKMIAYGFRTKQDLSKPLHPQIQNAIKKDFPKNDHFIWQAYDETPFNITVDEKNPVPQYLRRE